MKSTAVFSTAVALGLGIVVCAQDELNDETTGVCGFTLQAGGANVYRTNDFALTNSSDNNRLTWAQLYITDASTGRLYGGTGERCGFDPYLECDDDTDDEQDRSPFIIASNNSLTFHGQATFYLCNRNSFTSTDPDDQDDEEDRTNPDDLQLYSYIYPPIGTVTTNRQRNYENCTAVELIASGCQQNAANIFTQSPSAALQTPNPTGSPPAPATNTNSGNGAATGSSTPAQNGAVAKKAGFEVGAVSTGVLFAAVGFAWVL